MAKDAKEGGKNGWIVGSFMPEDSVAKTNDVEIKYWSFPVGKIDHPTKTSSIIEITMILEGSMSGQIDGKEIILKKGDYVVIQPNTINNTAQNALEPVTGITIKAPSDTTAKKIIK